MPRLTDASRQERMTQIAQAALRCFARAGFTGTSMADIIAESGLSAGSIYSHFAGKAELARFAAGSLLEARRASLAAMTAAGAAPTPAQVLMRLHEEMSAAGALGALVQIWAEASHDPALAAIADDKLGQIRSLLCATLRPWAAQQGGDADELAAAAADTVMVVFQGVTVRGSIQPDADASALLRSVATLLP